MSYHTAEILGTVLSALASAIPAGVYGLAVYILSSFSLYTIARRRGLNHAWLSWIPIGGSWILGSVSDQYRYVARGEVRSKRKWLLILNILSVVMKILAAAAAVAMAWDLVRYAFSGRDSQELVYRLMGMLASRRWMVLPALTISIAIKVIRFMALYDLYGSCEPSNKVLYLVLSILVGITEPIFLFLCREKDLGMPPRRQVTPPNVYQQ